MKPDLNKVLVSERDRHLLVVYRWSISNRGYVYCSRRGKDTLLLHRLIMGLEKGVPIQVDHINGNPLDNRRENLRLCTPIQNSYNLRASSRNRTGFKGVHHHTGRFVAAIKVNKKKIYLGRFKTPEEAARVYNAAALKYHGEFARFNNLPGIGSPGPALPEGSSTHGSLETSK